MDRVTHGAGQKWSVMMTNNTAQEAAQKARAEAQAAARRRAAAKKAEKERKRTRRRTACKRQFRSQDKTDLPQRMRQVASYI